VVLKLDVGTNFMVKLDCSCIMMAAWAGMDIAIDNLDEEKDFGTGF